MANNLSSNVVNKLVKGFLKAAQSSKVLTKTVSRAVITDSDFKNPKSGDRAYVRRPHDFFALETSDGDIDGETLNDIESGRAQVVAQDVITVPLQWGLVEKALYIGDDAVSEIMRAAAETVERTVEQNIATFAKNNLAHSLGTTNTPITTWEHVAQIGAFARSLGFPNGDVYGIINPYSRMKLAGQSLGLNSPDKVNSAWDNAMISRNVGGIITLESNALPSHTRGAGWTGDTITLDATPTQTYVAAKDTFQTTLALTGFDQNDTVLAGDRLQITSKSWVNYATKQAAVDGNGDNLAFQCVVVTGGTADVNGDVSVVVQGPAISEADGQYNNLLAALASGDSVTMLGTAGETKPQNLWYHKNALGLAFVDLNPLPAQESKTITTKGGFSIRMSIGSDILTAKSTLRLDVQPCLGTFNPLLGGVVHGY